MNMIKNTIVAIYKMVMMIIKLIVGIVASAVVFPIVTIVSVFVAGVCFIMSLIVAPVSKKVSANLMRKATYLFIYVPSFMLNYINGYLQLYIHPGMDVCLVSRVVRSITDLIYIVSVTRNQRTHVYY